MKKNAFTKFFISSTVNSFVQKHSVLPLLSDKSASSVFMLGGIFSYPESKNSILPVSGEIFQTNLSTAGKKDFLKCKITPDFYCFEILKRCKRQYIETIIKTEVWNLFFYDTVR
ncbi:hypothetical protein [Frigoriflavimonas asaccharolytica]|uniref:Uncharacterized protein n=1 Tax=Frigoriflavimonas asaccharolytica TaxID=2735899 RepID=A0A8J8K9V0_9FLAO|nr:hypothetical protein [Frigoriflavimonas asaccharolytica]NRS94051.1 hypothetical protein [Frigoriflavimonas asaccharolytica]